MHKYNVNIDSYRTNYFPQTQTQSWKNKANTPKPFITLGPCGSRGGSLPGHPPSIALVDLINKCVLWQTDWKAIEAAHREVQLLCRIIKSKPNSFVRKTLTGTVHNFESKISIYGTENLEWKDSTNLTTIFILSTNITMRHNIIFTQYRSCNSV